MWDEKRCDRTKKMVNYDLTCDQMKKIVNCDLIREKKVWCAFPPFPRVILNTSWRAGRCPWKKKNNFKNYFLAFVTPRVPMTAYKKFQPIRSSRSAGYTAHICESLVLLNKRCNSPCFHPQRHNPPSSCSPPPR